MGVGFFDCHKCGDSVCDCGDYTRCEECGNRFCVDCHPGGRHLEDDEATNCPVCSLDFVGDDRLVNWLLRRCKMSRKVAEQKYRAEEKEKKKRRKR